MHSDEIILEGFGLKASLLSFGATLRDLRIDGVSHPLVVGLAPEDVRAHANLYFGTVVGRVAGRIGYGRTQIAGNNVQLPINGDPHHLHGGPGGFSQRDWQVVGRSDQYAALALHSQAGDQGYAGSVDVTAHYEIVEGPILRLTLTARSSAETLLNLCHHPYFNFDGAPTINDHSLEIAADRYLPADETALPTGEVVGVDGPSDFRAPHQIGADAFDNTFCLSSAPMGPVAFAGRLSGGAVVMEVWTTQPGLHVYTGEGIPDGLAGLDGRQYGPRAGVALEAQGWPDAPNNAAFPSIRLKAEEVYEQVTEYRFGRS
ncbi:aldose epimerase family protein [Sulfitobacter sp. SK012]|uniref:aldose epimerase family protein n=1 Tax=Sulfitobacter sp. SK012 TaxID=1389005 RepID=UPI0013B392B4|nr:aldose epimerase family protein [Sulfitobacter sp. SK012]